MNQVKLGKFIRELRNELGMTQQELADKIEVSDKAISKWENARGMPDISLLIPLSNALNISVLELLNGERTKDYNKATIDLVKRNSNKVKFWKWWFFGITNIILVFMLMFSIYGYVIPASNPNIATIDSGSMTPEFDLLDAIVYDSVSIDKVNKGDFVVYNFIDDNGVIYTFEVVHVVEDVINDDGEIKLVTKGYNNIYPDTQYVTKDNFLGVYDHKISKFGSFFVRNNFLNTPMVLVFLILGIFSILFLDILQFGKKFK